MLRLVSREMLGLADMMNSKKAGTAGKVWEEWGKGQVGPQATGRS